MQVSLSISRISIEDVQAKVYETSGVKLEREVIFVGNF